MTENTDPDDPQKTDSTSTESSHFRDQHAVSVGRGPCLPCDACDTTQYTELHEISISERTYAVCGDCRQRLVAEIEEYHWWDRLTEAHYNRAAEFLRSLDAVWCVKDQEYAGGEL